MDPWQASPVSLVDRQMKTKKKGHWFPPKGETPPCFQRNMRNVCPYCGKNATTIIEKRIFKGADFTLDVGRRRRKCKECGERWNTFEIHGKFWKVIKKLAKELKKQEEQRGREGTKAVKARENEAEGIRRTVRKIEGSLSGGGLPDV